MTFIFQFIAGFLLDKKIGVNQPKRLENANILVANTPMDTDKIKVICFVWFDSLRLIDNLSVM